MNYQPPASPSSRANKIPASVWISALLVLSVFAAYWPVQSYAFTHYDDHNYVWQNPHVLGGLSWSGLTWAFTHFYVGNWHPLTWLSHMLDVQLYGLNAGGHHVTNLQFHVANTVLVFLWLKRLTGFQWRSAMVAALFGLHPLHVESVAWVAERKDVLSTFFFLLTLMAYTRYAQRRSRADSPGSKDQASGGASVLASRLVSSLAPPNHKKIALAVSPGGLALDSRHSAFDYCLALFFFALALMSKPMVVTLPFVLLLLDHWPLRRMGNDRPSPADAGFGPASKRRVRSLLLEKIPFFALTAASCVVTFLAQRGGKAVMSLSDLTITDRIENALISYAAYLQKMLWPHPLTVCYPLYFPIHADEAAAAALALLVISAVIFVFRRQQPWLVTGWLWYLGTLVPVIGLVQVGGESMADRYSYVPLIGIFIGLAWLIATVSSALPYRRLALAVLSLVVLTVCGVLTAGQVRYWQNSETLARHGIESMPGNAPMETLLGNAFLDQGRSEEACAPFAEAVRIWPDDVPLKYVQAKALIGARKFDEAINTCQAILRIQPNEPVILNMMANIYLMQGQWAEAIAANQAILQVAPNDLLVMNNQAWLLATVPDARLRNGAEAVRLAERVCQRTNYQLPLYVGTLGAAYAEAGRFKDAVNAAQTAINLAQKQHNPLVIRRNLQLLKLYRQQKPFHMPAGH
jgi:tetratricopeptide (TPR) repeat protein